MQKIVLIAIVLSLVLVGSSLVTVAFAAPPPVSRQMEIITATIEGGDPVTLDPAALYDTGSGELGHNCYDTLIDYNAEHMDQYLTSIASEYTLDPENITGTFNSVGVPLYYRYVFKLRTGVPYQNPAFGNVTTEDIEYCFERLLVMDYTGGPAWLIYEPLLNGVNHKFVAQRAVDPVNNASDAVFVGKCIDDSVGRNATHVWFNIAFPGAYAPFLQSLSGQWSSIYSKAWANSLGRSTNWPGSWGDYKGWVQYCDPLLPPFDDPTFVQMGTGPFILANLDRVLMYWDANRFTGYWRGWGNGPAPNYGVGWPAFGGSKPAGYVNHIKNTWAFDWPARSTMFLNGEVDFCAVNREYVDQILGQPNIRLTWPLPSLAVGAIHYVFDVSPTSPYQTVYDYGVLGEEGVPRDFFGNATYGVHVRKAFSYCLDFVDYLNTAWKNEAMHPPTALIPTLPYYDASVTAYNLDLAKAETEFKAAFPGLWTTGFKINLVYNSGNTARKLAMENMKAHVESLNTKFHVTVSPLAWSVIFVALDNFQLPAYAMGWNADFPDPHNFAYPYYGTGGTFTVYQGFSDATFDTLIRQGIQAPATARGAIYSAIQQRAVDLCINLPIYQALGRHFEVSWINGWYYNPIYGGNYFANLWKWYYTPHAQQDSIPANTTGYLLPYDVNYDGKTNMVDIGTTAASFGAIYGPPMSAKWVYRADFNNDRKIDMKDIGGVAKNFGKTAVAWAPV
jgi:peptide/nickel transport system substrate-binding protein